MATEEIINFDEEELEPVEVFDPSDMPDYPVVKDPPEGWPLLRACDGESWYEKACLYEAQTGRRVLPNGYSWYGDSVIKTEDHPMSRKEAEDGVE